MAKKQLSPFMPRKTMDTDYLLKLIEHAFDDIYQELKGKGWRFYLVDQKRGRCYYREKVVTIPVWVVMNGRVRQWVWYIAHELSHALVCEKLGISRAKKVGHGPAFQAILREICPEDVQHYEYEYKPRNASAAGLKQKEAV